MSLNYLALGKRIRTFRRRRNLSQNYVAEKTGKSTTFISYVENGTKHASLETLVDLANILGVTLDMLLGDELQYNRWVRDAEYQRTLEGLNEIESRIIMESARSLAQILHEVLMTGEER